MDAVRKMLDAMEKSGGQNEGAADHSGLIHTLERLTGGTSLPTRNMTMVAPPTIAHAVSMVIAPPPKPAPPPPPSPVVEADSRSAPTVADTAVRVDVGLLDKLMNLVGELVLTRNQLLSFSGRQPDEDTERAAHDAPVEPASPAELQAGVMRTRMQPIDNVWSKLPRIVRDLSVACGKQVRAGDHVEGRDTELDKTDPGGGEAIRSPTWSATAVDHGVETAGAPRSPSGSPPEGTLSLRAYARGRPGQHRDDCDDGAGIDVGPSEARRPSPAACDRPREAVERLTDREALEPDLRGRGSPPRSR